jgi:lysozyme family protein
MAIKKYKIVFEGFINSVLFYTNNLIDYGGEVFFGIERRRFPEWEGWRGVDYLKLKGILARERVGKGLMKLVVDFYRKEYWEKLQLERMPIEVAKNVFESAAVFGGTAAIFFLQRVINMLNWNGRQYRVLVVDGRMSEETIKTLNDCVKVYGTEKVARFIELMRVKRFLEILERDPTRRDLVERVV